MKLFTAVTAALLSFAVGAAVCTALQSSVTAEPEISAKACVLMDAQTGQVVFGMNENEKRPMASTTKIMTTLLTLESGGLDEPFVVDAEAIHVEGSSMGLQEGDIVTKRALCAGMLLPSGNDAANAAAVAVAGSIPDFLEMMNARAQAIGMSRSYFASPSGLDAEGHGASAFDMALLAAEALKNPEFAEICAQKEMTVTFGNPPFARVLTNTNKLLQMDESIIGMKTGFTDAAGRCLVSACCRDGRTLICVTLFDRDDWNDHLALYDYGFSLAQPHSLDIPDTLTVAVEGGEKQKVHIYAKNQPEVTAWRGIPPQLNETVLLPPFLTAPLAKGEEVGEIIYSTAQGAEVFRIPLYTAAEIPYQEAESAEEGLAERLRALWKRIYK